DGDGAQGHHVLETASFDEFKKEVANAVYPWLYTWIEPNYGDTAGGTYEGGNSQHPRDGVTQGEALIKATYEAIRNSPHWNTSLLIVTWGRARRFLRSRPTAAQRCAAR